MSHNELQGHKMRATPECWTLAPPLSLAPEAKAIHRRGISATRRLDNPTVYPLDH